METKEIFLNKEVVEMMKWQQKQETNKQINYILMLKKEGVDHIGY